MYAGRTLEFAMVTPLLGLDEPHKKHDMLLNRSCEIRLLLKLNSRCRLDVDVDMEGQRYKCSEMLP
jgi:hypothetical protein